MDNKGFDLESNADLRRYLQDQGLEIPNSQMPREFYLKERISDLEFSNLNKILRDFNALTAERKLYFSWAFLSVGTSTYPESYFEDLQNFFARNGYSLDDMITEQVNDYYDVTKNMSYGEYLAFRDECEFEARLPLQSKEEFEASKFGMQEDYSCQKRVGDIISRKGEDLDFLFLSEYVNESKYLADKFSDLAQTFHDSLDCGVFDVKEESSYLFGSNYMWIGNGPVVRYKPVEGSARSYKIRPKEGRDLHFYFKNDQVDLKMKKDNYLDLPFSLLIRKNAIWDLEEAFKNGKKGGVYESNTVLKYREIFETTKKV